MNISYEHPLSQVWEAVIVCFYNHR